MVLMAAGDRIKEIRKSHVPTLTQEGLAELTGLRRSRIAQYEAGRTDPPLDILAKIAAALHVPVISLLEEPKTPEPENKVPIRTKAEKTGRLKIYGGISAGFGNTSSIDTTEMDVPEQFARDDYGGLIIEGDSMEPFLESSDVAIFRDWYAPKPGYVVAACVNDTEWVCKLMVHEDGEYKLRSLNPKYPDIVANFKMAGFLVGYIRDAGPERVIRLNPFGVKPVQIIL